MIFTSISANLPTYIFLHCNLDKFGSEHKSKLANVYITFVFY